MRLTIRTRLLLNAAIVSSALAISACQVAPQEATRTGDEEVIESTDQAAGTLSPAVMRGISAVQELMKPAEGGERDLEEAKRLLDELADQRLARMNDFEKATLYNFYTNYYLAKEDYQGATDVFEDILEVPTLRADIRLRSLRSLGQLHSALENWSTSINYYEQWQSAADRNDDTVVLQGLSYANYQIENYSDALQHWTDYMLMKRERGEELTRDNYAYLNGLHFSLENWEQALEITEEMIRLFNTQIDRDNLKAIQEKLQEASTGIGAD